MVRCSFCGESIEKGTGKMFVYATGKISYFCSNKCEKNLIKLGRNPAHTRWTESYRTDSGKGGEKS